MKNAQKNTQSASATPGQLRRRLTSALLVLGLTVGTIATTATPVEAAAVVYTCYTAQYANFRLSGLIVRLQTKLSNGSVIIHDQKPLDANGCALLYVADPTWRQYPAQTVIEHNDVGSFYGARYDGWSYAASVWYAPLLTWLGYGYSTNGYALGGDDVWLLYGTVNCRGCQM